MIYEIPEQIIKDVSFERWRQERLRENGKFAATCATHGIDQMTETECFAVLGEEVGEVGEAFVALVLAQGRVARAASESIGGNVEAGRTELRKELIQVIAVALAWVERLDAEEGEAPPSRQSMGPIGTT